jgi:hypothetical protein
MVAIFVSCISHAAIILGDNTINSAALNFLVGSGFLLASIDSSLLISPAVRPLHDLNASKIGLRLVLAVRISTANDSSELDLRRRDVQSKAEGSRTN